MSEDEEAEDEDEEGEGEDDTEGEHEEEEDDEEGEAEATRPSLLVFFPKTSLFITQKLFQDQLDPARNKECPHSVVTGIVWFGLLCQLASCKGKELPRKCTDVGVMVSTLEASLAKLPRNGSSAADFFSRPPTFFVRGEGHLEFTAVDKHLLDPDLLRCHVFVAEYELFWWRTGLSSF